MPLVDLSPDAQLDGASPPKQPTLADLPADAQLDTQAQPQYRGAILPFTQDASGNTRLDWGSGLPGAIQKLAESAWSGVTAPADALAGQLQPGDPRVIDRALDTATIFSPVGVATRAGEIVPGAAAALQAPSAERLRQAANAGYDAARGSGLEIRGDAVGDMARGLQTTLQSDHGIIAKTAPKTFSILDELATPPAEAVATVPGIEAARRGLSALTLEGGTEGLAARNAVKRIDDFLGTLDSSNAVAGTAAPEAVAATLRDARGNYGAAMRSNSITGDFDKATTGIAERAENRAQASHSGANIDNSIRQRVASFLQSPDNVAGFSKPEIDALQAVVDGGFVQNAARKLSGYLGGGGGIGGLASAMGGAFAGGHLFGPEGGAIGAAAGPAVGASLKGLENSLARRSLNAADEVIRRNSPLADALAAEGSLLKPAMGRNNAVLRSVLPGLLSPSLQPSSQKPSMSLSQILASGA